MSTMRPPSITTSRWLVGTSVRFVSPCLSIVGHALGRGPSSRRVPWADDIQITKPGLILAADLEFGTTHQI